MRQIINFNSDWEFIKGENSPEKINLPHSWNNIDGQDGGNDYYRGTCKYIKKVSKSDLPQTDLVYLEIKGANSSADVTVNGKKLMTHDGGYSTFRVNITDVLEDENTIEIAVDNAANNSVYPQMADFTFYGGLYRDVNILGVNKKHFDLDYFGAPGIKITPQIIGKDAKVEIEVFLTNCDNDKIKYVIKDSDGNEISQIISAETKVDFNIENVHLWNGKKDPYLYTAEAFILENDVELDNVSSRFGCRTFKIDPNNGFILNGEEYPLRGVSRHQDRWGLGNALLPEHHKEDIDLILEVGATTIRLAHYQHDQYFYDLCDEKGLIIWAEIPYISNHMPTGRENTISQMKELVSQNYNHPSIVVWGLSNEITMSNDKDPDLLENHKILNDLVHDMDKTRLTTIAVVSMCDMDSPYIQIPDVVSYNHYFGWYGGNTDMNGPWFDEFHKKHPTIPIGCSEYGCEALNWHTSKPTQGDYTEEYQAYYHEELIKQLFSRKYMWATHVWNMFDFGADARAEGGENGQNHKGLITFDRKYKKDAFYAYKAWLSDEKFVHICGKRYIDRVEDVTKVTVYSNLPEVELFANGKSLGKKTCAEHFFYFDVPNSGETKLEAVAGEFKDESLIKKVETFNDEYRLKEKGAILNWFDVTEIDGYFSINDNLSDILETTRGKLVVLAFGMKLMKKIKGNSKDKSNDSKNEKGGFSIPKFNKNILQMLGGFSILRMSSMVGMVNITITKEELLKVNRQLNKVKRPKKQ